MGTKGVKRTAVAKEAAEAMADRLSSLGPVSPRGMFGGYGLFHEGVMFGLVNSEGTVHFRVGDDTRHHYEKAGAPSHGKMPYFAVPATVHARKASLLRWAKAAIDVAQREQLSKKTNNKKRSRKKS